MSLSGATEIRCRRRAPDVQRFLPARPHLGALRVIPVPGTRIVVAELFILHLIKLGVDLNDLAVRIAMEGRDIMTGAQSHRSPDDLDVFLLKQVAGILDVREVTKLECDVVHRAMRAGDEIDGVVVGIAAHEHEEVVDPVRHPEAECLRIEIR